MTGLRQLDTQQLKNLRAVVGLSQAEVAKRLGIALQSYNSKENGHRLIKAEELEQLARLFDVSMDELFKDPMALDLRMRVTHQNREAYGALRQVIEDYADIIVDADKHLKRLDTKLGGGGVH